MNSNKKKREICMDQATQDLFVLKAKANCSSEEEESDCSLGDQEELGQ